MVKDIKYYKNCFLHLNRSGKRGEKSPHKLILLLAVFERVEGLVAMGFAGQRMIGRCLIDLNPKLEQYFYANWHKYVNSEVFSPAFATPFYHMENEPFWKLTLKNGQKPASSQTETNLYKLYEGAYIDAELMALLTDETNREELRNYVIGLLSNEPEQIVTEKTEELPLENNEVEQPEIPEAEMEKMFMQFMREMGISEASVKKYSHHVIHNSQVKEIVQKYTGRDSLFSVTSVEDIKPILQEVKTSPFNIRGNNMYSVGVSHYLKFVTSGKFLDNTGIPKVRKAQSKIDIHVLHDEFWKAFIEYNKIHKGIYTSSDGTTHDWLGKRPLGIKGTSVNVIIGKKVCRSEVYIDTGNKEKNKQIFDFYQAFRSEIELQIPGLIWQRLDDKDACRIRIDKPLSFLKPEDREAIFDFFVTTTNQLVKVFAKYSTQYGNSSANKPSVELDISYYKKCIRTMANETTDYKAKVCKLLLLLSTFEYIPKCPSTGDVKNKIPLLAAWEGVFLNNVKKHIGKIGRESTLFSTPFILLDEVPFWHLLPIQANYQRTGYPFKTFANLQDIYSGVEIDEELVALIHKTSSREELKNFVLSLMPKEDKQSVKKPAQQKQSENVWHKVTKIFRRK